MAILTPGLKPSTVDERDFKLGAVIQLPLLSSLPVSYRAEPFSIKNQIEDGNDDFCAAYAGTGMIEPKEEVELYPAFLFAAAKFESGEDPKEWGLQLRDVAKALTKWGAPEAKDIPLEVKHLEPFARRYFDNYPQPVRDSAAKHKAESYLTVTGPYDHFDNVRAFLWKFRDLKQHVIFGTEFGWRLTEDFLTGNPKGYGHAMWIPGWEEEFILTTNSAGKEAGINGVHKMDRETFNRSVDRFGALVVVDIARSEIEAAMGMREETITVQKENWFIRLLRYLFNF